MRHRLPGAPRAGPPGVPMPGSPALRLTDVFAGAHEKDADACVCRLLAALPEDVAAELRLGASAAVMVLYRGPRVTVRLWLFDQDGNVASTLDVGKGFSSDLPLLRAACKRLKLPIQGADEPAVATLLPPRSETWP